MAKNEFVADYVSTPGDVLLHAMVFSLRKRTNLRVAVLEGILSGKQPITANIAKRLEEALGVSAAHWKSVEQRYRASIKETERRLKRVK